PGRDRQHREDGHSRARWHCRAESGGQDAGARGTDRPAQPESGGADRVHEAARGGGGNQSGAGRRAINSRAKQRTREHGSSDRTLLGVRRSRMNWLAFIAEIIKAIAWPITVVVVLVI